MAVTVTLTGRLIGTPLLNYCGWVYNQSSLPTMCMYNIYVLEGGVVKYSKDRFITYPPREYQLKLKLEKFHGRRIKVIVVVESKQ